MAVMVTAGIVVGVVMPYTPDRVDDELVAFLVGLSLTLAFFFRNPPS